VPGNNFNFIFKNIEVKQSNYGPGQALRVPGGLSQPQGHSAAGRIVPMKNSSNTIWNGTCDLPVCSTVHHNRPLLTLPLLLLMIKYRLCVNIIGHNIRVKKVSRSAALLL
jgi:hypothetical protein